MLDFVKQIFVKGEWPELLDAEQYDDQFVLHFFINADLQWLQGHFPGQPVLAGVVQTHWACALAQHLFAIAQAPMRIDNLKFQNVILPSQTVCLELTRKSSAAPVTFRYLLFPYTNTQTPGHIFSEGKIVF